MAETYDLTLNLEKIREVQAENNTVAKTNGINYFSNPIEQVQKKEKIETFAKIMDNSDNYSVLIYRQHGTGRAEIYSGLYRIEYEKFTNEAARQGVRTLLKFGSFDKNPKRRIPYNVQFKKRIRF
jgi:protein tyrosine phosphatase (PTP) superfamily phosphohydrolase (DUF442 family)